MVWGSLRPHKTPLIHNSQFLFWCLVVQSGGQKYWSKNTTVIIESRMVDTASTYIHLPSMMHAVKRLHEITYIYLAGLLAKKTPGPRIYRPVNFADD